MNILTTISLIPDTVNHIHSPITPIRVKRQSHPLLFHRLGQAYNATCNFDFFSVPSSKCTVFGCKSVERKHVFPSDNDLFNIWIQKCKNQKLLLLDKETVDCMQFVINILDLNVKVRGQQN